MGESTHIQWATDTYNPWRGCRPVSPGCTNCYIVRTPPFRISGQKHGHERIRASEATLKAPLRWNKKPWVCDRCGLCSGTAEQIVKLTGVAICECGCQTWHRRRVFCLSLGDWLDDEVPIEWLADLLKVIHQTPNLDWLLLTKRPENFVPRIQAAHNWLCLAFHKNAPACAWLSDWLEGSQPRNIWFGVSVENQKTADERIPILLGIPARVRFLSVEPMLEPILLDGLHRTKGNDFPKLDWIILGGESGPKARHCNIEWIRDGVQQCKVAGVATFVKQLGSNPAPIKVENGSVKERLWLKDKKGGDPSEWPEDLRVREFPNVPENVLRATPTDCGREAACGKCDVCKYLEFIEHAQSVAPPESTIQRNYEIEQYISRTYP